MDDLLHAQADGTEEDTALIEIGDAAVLTEGQGGGSSEDKRRAYNS
jgi:hypothetical protein